jgi:hypothetical protein
MNSPFSVGVSTLTSNSIMEELRIRIRDAKLLPSECVCQVENFSIGEDIKTIRRVFIQDQSRVHYEVGWVVDSDLDCCMICLKQFNNIFFRFRHHCRACGALICAECSPYKTRIPGLVAEETTSRVCLNCFGLKVTVQDPAEIQRKQEAASFENTQRPFNFEAYKYCTHHTPILFSTYVLPRFYQMRVCVIGRCACSFLPTSPAPTSAR